MKLDLQLGDCLELMPSMPSASVDMICTDLPYGTTNCRWDSVIEFAPMWEQYQRILKPSGVIVLTASQPFTSALVMSNPKWFKYELIWDKKNGKAPGVAKYRPMPSHESVLIFGKGTNTYNPQWLPGKPYVDKRSKPALRDQEDGHKFGYTGELNIINDGRRHPLSVVEIKTVSERGSLHPTQKPIALLEWLVRTYTNAGDTVLDSCMGSGTTGVACMTLARKFIGIEKDEKYFQVASDRIRASVPQAANDSAPAIEQLAINFA